MKKIITTALTVLFLTQITSCTKNDVATPINYSIQGLWIGSYSINGQTVNTDTYYSFVVKPDGSIYLETKYLGQSQLAAGTWTLTGNEFTCSYTYFYGAADYIGTVQSVTASWKNSKKLSGTWKNTSPSNGVNGIFTISKVE